MTNYSLFTEKDFCENNHENNYYDPSIDAYVCPTCEAISPASSIFSIEDKTEDEYEHHIGI